MPNESTFVSGRLGLQGREVLRRIFAFLFWLFARVEIVGLEQVPRTGGHLITPNHLSRFDAALVFAALPQRRLVAFVADTYRRRAFFRWITEMIDVIWVNRGATGPSVIKAAVQVLRAGHLLGLAPEGTRSPTHQLQTGKTGAAFLALTANVPLIPVAVTNTEHLGVAMKRWHRIPIRIEFGKPYTLPPPPTRRPDEAHLETCTTEIMCRIAALLPPEYRGVYADHPRTQALLIDDC